VASEEDENGSSKVAFLIIVTGSVARARSVEAEGINLLLVLPVKCLG